MRTGKREQPDDGKGDALMRKNRPKGVSAKTLYRRRAAMSPSFSMKKKEHISIFLVVRYQRLSYFTASNWRRKLTAFGNASRQRRKCASARR